MCTDVYTCVHKGTDQTLSEKGLIIINAFLSLHMCKLTRAQSAIHEILPEKFTQSNIIMHYMSHSIAPPPLHAHTCTHAHQTHTISQPLASPSLSVSVHFPPHPTQKNSN